MYEFKTTKEGKYQIKSILHIFWEICSNYLGNSGKSGTDVELICLSDCGLFLSLTHKNVRKLSAWTEVERPVQTEVAKATQANVTMWSWGWSWTGKVPIRGKPKQQTCNMQDQNPQDLQKKPAWRKIIVIISVINKYNLLYFIRRTSI